jgi:DNA-binding beta-propeller fold protein YncE
MLHLALGCSFCLGLTVIVASAPAAPEPPRDPLPKHALVRLGTARLRLGDEAPAKQSTPGAESPDSIQAVAFTAAGRHLLTGDPAQLTLWDIQAANRVSSVAVPAFCLGLDGTGRVLVAGSARQVAIWPSSDWSNPMPQLLPPTQTVLSAADAVRALALAPDGRMLLAQGGGGRLSVGDPQTGTITRDIILPAEPVTVAMAPNGRWAGVVTRDGLLRLWSVGPIGKDASADHEVWRRRMPRSQRASVAFSPDGGLVAVASAGQVTLLDAINGQLLRRLLRDFGDGDMRALAFSPDGRLVAAGVGGPEGAVHVWEVWTGKAVAKFEGHRGPVNAIAFSPDSKLVGSGGEDGTVLIWDANLAPRPKEEPAFPLDQAWEALDSLDVREAHRAVGSLKGAGSEGVVVIREGLRRVSIEQKRIRLWIADLDDMQFRVRETARKNLVAQGLRAVPALLDAQAGQPSAEVERHLRLIFEELEAGGVIAPQGILFGEPLRAARAVQVLEGIDSKESLNVLAQIAAGPPDARATLEAKAAVSRLRR